jgi:diguanylate cyclase (GGDEF)-like protein
MKTPRFSVNMFRILGITVVIIITVHAIIYQSLIRHNTAVQIFLRGEALAYPLCEKTKFSLESGGTSKSLYGLYGLSNFCKQIYRSSKDLSEVAVLDGQGRILACQDIQRIGHKESIMTDLGNKPRVFKETPDSLDTYLLAQQYSKKPIYVKISFSKNLLKKQSRQAFLIAFFYTITAIFVLQIVIYFLTNILLGKRIAKILDGFNALAEGKFDIRLINPQSEPAKSKFLHSYDELDFLMQSFDKMAGQLQEIDAKRKNQEKQLGFLATHDQLTGLPNRRLLENALKKGVARARRGTQSTFMMMDLDNFKVVNDTLGHTTGDKVLVIFTGLLQKQLRSCDLLARIGGDEFALLLEGEDTNEAKVVAERICQAIEEQRFVFDNHSFHLGLSIGIVPIDGNCDQGTLLSQADTAMYTAKRQGRNRVVLYYPEDNTMFRLSQTNETVSLIKDALEGNGFLLYFQPVVRLEDNRIEHYEALIRLKSNDVIITPDVFLPAAEQFGLMPQIDRWVVRHVLYNLQKNSEIRVFVNLSGYSLADEALLIYIEDSIMQYGIEPGRIGFEITETSVIRDLKLAQEWINRLKAYGCCFSLDDFGAGFNSFSYLRNLPVNQLKLDGTFISSLDSDLTLRYLVQAMYDLAKALNLETVAEFVESAETVQILKEIGVTYGQGYYLGKPGPEFLAMQNL